MNSRRLIIFGFGGHARSVADVALSCGYSELLFVDPNARDGETFLGHPVVPNLNSESMQGWEMFPATGDNDRRREQYCEILHVGQIPVSLVSPTASVGAGGVISPGCFIGHHAHVGPMAEIGQGCIINTGAVIEHECMVGSYSHVSINSAIAGRSRLGSHSMLGAGATIIDGISVCDRVTIGAGALVLRSIDAAGTYVGVPATLRS